MTKIGEICELKYGSSLPERSRESGKIPVYGSNGIVGFHNKAATNGPTLIVGRKGSAGKIQFSDIGCFPIDTTYYIDETLKECNLKWLFYCLSFNDLSRYNKAAAVPGINRNDVYDLTIPFPRLKEQNEIAYVLEQADKARQQRKAANALTDQFLQSSFLSLFGDPVNNEKGWEVKKIGDFTPNILSGKSVESESRMKAKNEYGVLKVSSVTYGVFKPEEHKAIVNGYVPDKKITPKKGDILFSRANTKELVAATCIVDKDYPDLFLPDKLWKVNIDRTVVNEWFFKYVLSQQSYRTKLSEKSTGTSGSMFNISKEKLVDFYFPIPPLSLQQQFAGIVAQAEQLRQKQRESERELEILFQSLLQQYFG